MELEEQLMLQKWLHGLLLSMRAGEFNSVISELETALGRIEEDQEAHGILVPDEFRTKPVAPPSLWTRIKSSIGKH